MPDAIPRVCRERVRLIDDYNVTVHSYADLIQKVRDLIEMGLQAEVEMLSRRCRTTWDSVERARVALYRHESNHNCCWGLHEVAPQDNHR